MHSGASPSLDDCSFLDNSFGCRGNPKLRIFYPSFIHRKITQNLKTSITQNSTENLISSVSIRKNKSPLFFTVVKSLFIYIGVISNVFQLLHGSHPLILPIDQNKQTTHRKQNLSKTEETIVICRFRILLEPQKL